MFHVQHHLALTRRSTLTSRSIPETAWTSRIDESRTAASVRVTPSPQSQWSDT